MTFITEDSAVSVLCFFFGGNNMSEFSGIELNEAARAISSTRMKSEKAILKLKENTAQYRLTARGIAAYSLALLLIAREQGEASEQIVFPKDELEQAEDAFLSTTDRVKNVLPKFTADTPQHTLAVRRLRAFEIARELIGREEAKL
jgi:hypothetical protein